MNTKVKIDSLKLTLPQSHVQIIDNKLGEKFQRLYLKTGELEKRMAPDTGQLEDHINLQNHIVDETKGIKSRIALGTWTHGTQISKVVYIQINAKMLKSRYDEGINLENWREVYNHIINLRVVYIDERAFLNALISDVDFCHDFKCNPAELIEFTSRLKALVLPNLEKYIYGQWKKNINVGLQFRERSKGTPAKPFIKYYHKGLELFYNSTEFYEEFLKENGVNYKETARLEINMKNSAYKKHHNLLHIKTFIDLLEMKEKEKEKILFSSTKKYINNLEKAASNGEAGLQIFDDKQKRHRMNKKLTKLFDEIGDQKTLKENTRIDEIFKQLQLLQ